MIMKQRIALLLVAGLCSVSGQTAKPPEEKAALRQPRAEEMAANTKKKLEAEQVAVEAETKDIKNRWMKPLWEDYAARYLGMTDLERIRRKEALLAARTVALKLMEGKTLPKEVLAWSKLVIKKKIEFGMPAEFIALSWGDPIKKKTSLDSLPIWIYEGKGDKRHELMLKDGRLKQWGRYS